MAWYNFPVHPMDPVNPEGQQEFTTHYLRDSFTGGGQNSHVLPPTQDQSLWESLLNVMPITRGVLERRWGYNFVATGLNPTDRMFTYQRDFDNLRCLVMTGQVGPVQALTELGAIYNNAIFTPTVEANPLRMINSRSFAYFFNGAQVDLQKWDGGAATNTTNWGIDVNDVTSGSTFGPNGPITATDLADHAHAWTNPNNIKANDGAVAVATIVAGNPGPTNTIRASNFALSATGSQVLGIQVDIKLQTTSSVSSQVPMTIQLVKAGFINPVGTAKNALIAPSGSLLFTTFGGPGDLWGADWDIGDINTTGFGVNIQAQQNGTANTITGATVAQQGDYFSPPTSVTLVGGGGTGATAGRTIGTTGTGPGLHYYVKSVYIINPGTGYTSAPAVQFNGGSIDGLGATAHVTFSGGTSGTETLSIDYVRVTVTTVPGAGITITGTAAGNVDLTIGRIYYLAFVNNNTGHYSDISSASATTGPATNLEFNLTLSVNNDPQVTQAVILATADGGDPSILYQVAQITNGTTTYTDNTPEEDLVNNQQLLYTDQFGNDFGLAENTPPPPGQYAIKHQGRLWMAVGQNLYFSKATSELTLPNGFIAGKYEEAFPATNYFDISEGAETISGLQSDGQTLYIGTQSHIRKLVGNDPTNFEEPQVVHAEVGLLNQEVWEIVYTQGSPSGCIWLTPDFRVIGSDFNTYTDIGGAVQDVLNSVQPSAQSLAHGTFVSDGEYDLYILSVPVASSTYCDTQLIYDLRAHMWFVWQPTDGSLAGLYNINISGQPMWLFIDKTGTNLYQYSPTFSSDNGVLFPVTATTVWMHFGEPTKRKLLDELEVTGDSTMQVDILGASSQSEFSDPQVVCTSQPLILSPFGQDKVYLASFRAISRYYQLTFNSLSASMDFLDGYNLRYIPWNSL